jgi:hypothetical protein
MLLTPDSDGCGPYVPPINGFNDYVTPEKIGRLFEKSADGFLVSKEFIK